MSGSTFLLFSAAATVSCVLYLQVGGVTMMDAISLPEHARKEVVYGENSDVLRLIETIIDRSDDLSDARSRITSARWPDKVLHVCLTSHSANYSSLSTKKSGATSPTGYSKTAWTSMHTVVRDGAGFGSALTDNGLCNLVVIDNFRKCRGSENIGYTIYIERRR